MQKQRNSQVLHAYIYFQLIEVDEVEKKEIRKIYACKQCKEKMFETL